MPRGQDRINRPAAPSAAHENTTGLQNPRHIRENRLPIRQQVDYVQAENGIEGLIRRLELCQRAAGDCDVFDPCVACPAASDLEHLLGDVDRIDVLHVWRMVNGRCAGSAPELENPHLGREVAPGFVEFSPVALSATGLFAYRSAVLSQNLSDSVMPIPVREAACHCRMPAGWPDRRV